MRARDRFIDSGGRNPGPILEQVETVRRGLEANRYAQEKREEREQILGAIGLWLGLLAQVGIRIRGVEGSL